MQRETGKLIPQELVALATVCKALLVIVNARLFTLLGMLLCAAAFGYVLWQPDWIRAFAACAFACLVYWPLVRMEVKRTAQPEGEQ